VKALEELLEVPLFHRLTRALRLTEAGQEALPGLTEGLDTLAHTVDRLRGYREDPVLTISVGPSFGSIWLVPRLERFRARHPEIEIRLDGTERRVDVAKGEADVALRYGAGGYSGVQVDYLFGQSNIPVCSPALLDGDTPLNRPGDLRHHTLLHIDWKETEASWRMWLSAAGLTDIDPIRGPVFTQESMAVQAARDGQGVALVGTQLVADDLASGALVRPFDENLATPLSFAFYLLTPKDGDRRPKIAAFRKWMLEEVRPVRFGTVV